MKTWTLTEKTPTDNGNDVSLSHGNISIDTDLEALRTRIDANLQIVKGELQDSAMGVDYFGVIFGNGPLSFKVQELSSVISGIDGVREVLFNGAKTNKQTNTLTFEFTIKSIYGDIEYEKSFENIA